MKYKIYLKSRGWPMDDIDLFKNVKGIGQEKFDEIKELLVIE